MNQLFFEILRIAIGQQQELAFSPTHDQWREIYQMSIRQTLVGVMYPAIEQLPEHQRPLKDVLLQWYLMKERIVQQNRLLNQRALETITFFQQEGFDCCILKGQGISTLYPNPLLRTSGDIDIWLSGGRKKIYDFAQSRVGLQGLTYRHIHYPLHKDVEVEVHITPGSLYAPIDNRKLQQYFVKSAPEQFHHKVQLPDDIGNIPTPTDEFNRLYILLHIYEHFLGEGVGFRQVLDYYYVLRQPITTESKQRTINMLRKLNMLRFTRAMMWVQQEVLGLESKYFLVEPDEKEGRFLLSEIMQAGNFGKYDSRMNWQNHHKLIPRLWNSIKRNSKFVVRYPHEMIWDLPFRTCQFIWRFITLKNVRFK